VYYSNGNSSLGLAMALVKRVQNMAPTLKLDITIPLINPFLLGKYCHEFLRPGIYRRPKDNPMTTAYKKINTEALVTYEQEKRLKNISNPPIET